MTGKSIFPLILAVTLPVSGMWLPLPNPSGSTVLNLSVQGNCIVAGTREDGVLRSCTDGRDWQPLNRNLPHPWIPALASMGDTLFASSNGIQYRLIGKDSAWQLLPEATKVGPLALVAEKGILYAAGGTGIWISRDRGDTWEQSGLDHHSVRDIAMSGGKQYATDGNVYVRTGLGLEWTVISNSPSTPDFWRVAATSRAVVAASPDSGVYRTLDGGVTWQPCTNGLGRDFYSLKADGETLFAFSDKGFYRSDSHGDSWVKSIVGPPGTAITVVARSGNGLITAGSGVSGLFRSLDHGKTWSGFGNALPSAYVKWTAADGNKWFANVSGGSLFGWDDSDRTWSLLKTSSYTREVKYFGGWLTNQESSGSDSLSIDGGSVWNPVKLPPGIQGGARLGSELFLYEIRSGVMRSKDTGKSFSTANTGLPATWVRLKVPWIEYRLRDLLAAGKDLYAATDSGLYRTRDSGSSWHFVPLPGADGGRLAINRLATGSGGIFASGVGAFFRSLDGGFTWSRGASVGLAASLEAYRGNVFAAVGNEVYHSPANEISWTQISDGMPGVPVSSLTLGDGVLIAGTAGAGLWKRDLAEITSVRNRQGVARRKSGWRLERRSAIILRNGRQEATLAGRMLGAAPKPAPAH